MSDLVVAIGLVMVIRVLLWAAAPGWASSCWQPRHVPEHTLRAAVPPRRRRVRDRVAGAWLKRAFDNRCVVVESGLD
jgi:hypothetical protein